MPAEVKEGGAAAEWRQNWPVVMAACAGVGTATIITYSSGLFLEPLEQEFGWSRAEIMSGHAIASTAGVICAPFTGMFVDRIGPRRIGIVAVILICLTTALFSLTGPNIWHWRALWVPFSIAIVLIQPSVWTAAVTSLFSAGRGLALAVTLCGSSIGSIVTPPLTFYLIESVGWRLAFVCLGAVWAFIALPPIWLFFSSSRDRVRLAPDQMQASAALPRPSIWQSGILTRRYPQLLLAGVCIAGVVVTMAVSVVPILSSSGISRGEAAGIASLIGVTAIFGRLTIGALLDRMNGRLIAAGCVLLPILGLLILIHFPGSTLAASAAVLIFGFSLGAELDIVAYLTSRYFGTQNFGFLFGTIGGFIGLAGANGPIALNAVYDATGSYVPALWAAMPLCLLSALLFLLLGPYPKREVPE